MENKSLNELEQKWEKFLFINLQFPTSESKVAALEDYLTCFMNSLSGNDIFPQQQFRDCIGAAGIVTRCFLDDVAQLCLSCTSDTQQRLLNYLFCGRGSRLMRLMEKIGVGAITCNYELTELLLSLLPYLRSQSLVDGAIDNGLNRFTASCSDELKVKTGRSNVLTDSSVTEVESASEISCEEPAKMENRELKNMHNSKNALDSIFNLLQQLCQADVEDCSSMPFSNNASATVLSVLTEQLSAIEEEEIKDVSLTHSYITRKMISLIVNIGTSLLRFKDPLTRISHISRSLYQFLSCRLKELDALYASGAAESSQSETLMDEVTNCTVGIIDILYTASDVNNSVIGYKEALQIFNLFLSEDGCEVLMKSVHYLSSQTDRFEAASRVVSLLGQTGMNIKKLRLEARQLHLKDRSMTKRWRLDVTSHHHYQAKSELSICPVSSISRFLLMLVNRMEDEVLRSTVLNALAKCGICCCVDLHEIYSVMFTNFSELSRNLQEQRLRFLEYSVMSLSGFQVLFERTVATCESCKRRTQEAEKTLGEVYLTLTTSKSLEVLYTYTPFLDGFWKVFRVYKDIITNSSAPSLILLIEKHLLSIVNGVHNTVVQLELFLRSILPLLTHYSRSYLDGDDVTILRCMLNVVLVYADVPEVNRILHVINIMANLYRVMCSPKLRDVVLRLLHILALVNWINEPETHLEKFEKYNVDGEDMRAILDIYHEILVQHTIRYQNSVPELNLGGSSYEFQSSADDHCRTSIVAHLENDDQLLLCLRDLWRTMSCIADRGVEHRQWLWEKSLKLRMSEFTIALARRNWSYSADNEVEWEILGILVHLIVTCESTNGTSIVNDLKCVFMFSGKTCTELYTTVDCLLRNLTMASLETNRIALEYAMTSFNAKRPTDGNEHLSASEVEDMSLDSTSSYEYDYDADVEDNDTFLHRGEFPLAKLYKAEPWSDVSTKLTCPSVLNLALQITLEYKDQLKAEEKFLETKLLAPIENIIQTLSYICKSSASNYHVLLKKCRITTIVLKDFHDILISEDSASHLPLQNALLDLLAFCVRDSMLDWELKSLLQLFVTNPSLSPRLLACLGSILNTVKPEPPFYINFLHSKSAEDVFRSDYEIVGESKTDRLNEASVNVLEAAASHKLQHTNHSSFAVAAAAGCFPQLTSSGNFPFGDSGLSISLWFYMPEDHFSRGYVGTGSQTRTIHLFTCAHDGFAIEFWAHLDTKLLILKLVSWSKDVHEILDTKLSTNQLSMKSWQHLFISWVSFRKGKNLVVLTYVSEGASSEKQLEKFTLECEWPKLSKNQRFWYVLMGHSGVQEESELAWRLGHLKIFNGSCVNNEAAVLLSKLGPGNTQLHILQSGLVDKSNVLQKFPLDNNLVNLQKKLLISYLPQNPTVFIWHSENVGEISRSSSNVAESLVKIVKLGRLRSSRSSSLHVALTRVGGAPIFISLFGLIVANHSQDDNLQANCLQLLTELIKRDGKIMKHFLECAGWELVLWVMSTSRCKISCRMLMILLRECTSDPVLIYSQSDQKWTVQKASSATVVNPKLLSLLLCNWKMWNNSSKDILHWLLKCCLFLVEGSHPKREINLKIFHELDVFEIIMDILKERCLGENQTTFSTASCRCMVRLLEILCGKKVTIQCLSMLTDCLIAIHPFNLTYVCHARTSFYFVLEKQFGGNRSSRSVATPTSSKYGKGVVNEQLKMVQTSASLSTSNSDTSSEYQSFADHQAEKIESMAKDSECSYYIAQENLPTFQNVEFPSESPVERLPEHLGDEREIQSTSGSNQPFLKPNSESLASSSLSFTVGPDTVLSKEQNVQDYHTRSSNNDEASFGDIGIVAKGILTIIGHTLVEADKHFFSEAIKVIDCKLLVVFALHPHEGVRTEVVKILRTYLSKTNEDRGLDTFKKKSLFIALANQLYQYKTEVPLAEACLELLLGDIFTFQSSSKLLPFYHRIDQASAIPLVLSILPRLCHNTELCQEFIKVFNHLCRSQSDLYLLLFDNGLVQSVCLAISTIVHSKDLLHQSNIATDWHLNPPLICLNGFLAEAVYYYLWFGNASQFGKVVEALALISFYEDLEILRYGLTSQFNLAFRNCQCECLITTLVTLLINFEWNEEELESSCKNDYISKVMIHSYPIPTKLPADVDLHNRFGIIICSTVNYFINAAERDIKDAYLSAKEEWLSQFVFRVLLDGAVTSLCPSQWPFQSSWKLLSNTMRSCFYYHLLQMLLYILSQNQTISYRLKAVDHLISSQRHIDTVLFLLRNDIKCRQQVISDLDVLLREGVDISHDEIAKCITLQMELQKEFNYSMFDAADVSKNLTRGGKWICPNPNMQKLFEKFECKIKDVVKFAEQAAVVVSKKQEEQTKRFYSCIKDKFSARLYIRQKWQSVVSRLTHERAVWHHKQSYSRSWQLDSTEGPHRIRKRLKRCPTMVEERFLLPNAREKLKSSNFVHPFALLFEDENVSDNRAAIHNNIQTKEKISFASLCSIITPSIESGGEILFGADCIYYIGEEKNQLVNSLVSIKNDVICHSWKFHEITEIHKRRYQLQDNAVEIFLSYGQTHLLAFTSTQERNTIYDRLLAVELPNLVPEHDNLDNHTQMWRDGAITNYEYLIQLNKFAGRTFNDLMQYPVFPFILADYTSPLLDLKNGDSFRNLAKPMAIQNKDREPHYLNQYNFLRNEQEECGSSVAPTVGPYHYGSHYSNSGIVLHFLVRLPPFTNIFLQFQDNNFDIPDRTFHSVATSWRLASADSTTDVKELIPEFFFLPEMFVNGEGYNFGVRQTSEQVDDVEIPGWARGDPRLFSLIHRQALEAPYVTENLHHWIDLVFGFKQTGKAAVEAMNVFHPATYYGFDINQLRDPLRLNAMKTMIRTFGQTPVQIFRRSHPLVSLSLTQQTLPSCDRRVLGEVVGLNWGKYVGSPSESEPAEISRKQLFQPIVSYISVVTNEVFGLTSKTALLVQYCKDKGVSIINTTYIASAALIRWGHDGVIWIQLRRDQQAQPFAAIDVANSLTCCATIPDSKFIFFGRSSGNIVVYHISFDSVNIGPQATVKWNKITHLYGHDAEVTAINICKEFSIAVSASADSTCIIWDLNPLKYIRSIRDHKRSIQLICVSRTSGDIASVSHNPDNGSTLKLHTINAKLIEEVTSTEKIHSICFSCAPEGTSVNVICAGLENGSIMMWSSWDLNPVRIIKLSRYNRPIVCLGYSLDCQHLYAANEDGLLVILESSSCSCQVPKFRTIL